VTYQSALERRYRRLLWSYPRGFRETHGEEILSVLMACARPGQERPGLAASADLIRSGLWMRLRPSLPPSAPSVRRAVWLMYIGASVTALTLIGVLISYPFGDESATLRFAGRPQPVAVALTAGVVIALLTVGVWMLMARATSKGKHWVRTAATVLVALETFQLASPIGLQEVFAGVTWLIGLTTVSLLWRKDASTFFEQRRGAAALKRST
jgi:hypothetical protein